MPVDSKVGRRHWGWLILLVTFWKFQHFNLVSKIFQKLFKPLPCHKSIGKMLHAICISAVAVSLRWASCGPWASCFLFLKENICCGHSLEEPHWGTSNEHPQHFFSLRNKKNTVKPVLVVTSIKQPTCIKQPEGSCPKIHILIYLNCIKQPPAFSSHILSFPWVAA